MVKKYAQRIGLDPATVGGHSLRSGLVTAAVTAGVSDTAIMRVTGHRSSVMVERYVRSLFVRNPLSGIL